MKWMHLPPEHTLGKILCHNIADAQGHKALHKGARVGEKELAQLRALGLREVTVAALEPGDVHEDEAAERLTRACAGDGVALSEASGGRANLLAARAGVLKVNADALFEVNRIEGLTIATLPRDRVVAARRMVATIKIIPFAVPERELARAEAIGVAHGGLIAVRAMPPAQVGVLLTGGEPARERVLKSFAPAIRSRIEELGSAALEVVYAPHQSEAIAGALLRLRAAGAALIVIAGETSIMDREDVTPRGIAQAGGRIEHYGAPVEPGNLLLLAYLDDALPVIGAPGCVRSRDLNVVDLILPRLLAGERLTRADIAQLGDGGLLL
ncbi:MAG: molybdopterin-binding protein [Chloroflexi bacterium]|nr:molybdopterin-binding protein [Chloroflexota bacterium]